MLFDSTLAQHAAQEMLVRNVGQHIHSIKYKRFHLISWWGKFPRFSSHLAQKYVETFSLRKRKLDEKSCILCPSWHSLRLPLQCQISKHFSICFWESSWLGIFPSNENLLRNNCLIFVKAYRRCNVSSITNIFLHDFWQKVNFCQKTGFKKHDTRKQVCIFRSTDLGKVRQFSQTLDIAERKRFSKILKKSIKPCPVPMT